MITQQQINLAAPVEFQSQNYEQEQDEKKLMEHIAMLEDKVQKLRENATAMSGDQLLSIDMYKSTQM